MEVWKGAVAAHDNRNVSPVYRGFEFSVCHSLSFLCRFLGLWCEHIMHTGDSVWAFNWESMLCEKNRICETAVDMTIKTLLLSWCSIIIRILRQMHWMIRNWYWPLQGQGCNSNVSLVSLGAKSTLLHSTTSHFRITGNFETVDTKA